MFVHRIFVCAGVCACACMCTHMCMLYEVTSLTPSLPDTPIGVEWATRAKVAEAEKDKLLEMITLLHQR